VPESLAETVLIYLRQRFRVRITDIKIGGELLLEASPASGRVWRVHAAGLDDYNAVLHLAELMGCELPPG
jgi:hypothetical protein